MTNSTVNGTLTPITFTLTLSAPSNVDTTVTGASADGTAMAGVDYGPVSGSFTIPAGKTSATFVVNAIGTSVYKPTLNFTVNLTGARTPRWARRARRPRRF